MDIDSDCIRDLRIDDQAPNVSRSIPRVSLSPSDLPVDTLAAQSTTAVAPLPSTRRQTKKKKSQPASKPIDTSNNRCFTFIRDDVFDTKTFSRGRTELYSKSDMEKYDRAFQKQLLFDFSERRASKKKQHSIGRASRSQAFNLDENLDAFSGNCANFQDLSRYILEDIIKCRSGEQFLLCLPSKAGDALGLDLIKTSREQQRLCKGGEQCLIAGKSYYCFKVTMDMCPNHEEIALGMSQAQFS
jgi:hypothetical protein